MIHAFSSRCRRGYSLTVVLLFLVLLLCLWAAVYRTTASFLRVETARVKRNDLDNGMLGALAQVLWYLETHPVPSAGPYATPVNPDNPKDEFHSHVHPPPGSNWSITVTPGTCQRLCPEPGTTRSPRSPRNKAARSNRNNH